MEMVYIIQVSFGSFDSHHTKIGKVFKDKEEAVKYKRKYHKVADSISCTIFEYFMELDDLDEDSDEYRFKQKMWLKYHSKFGEYDTTDVIARKLN